MIKRINKKLGLKLFLIILVVLITVSMLIYGGLRFFMPKVFQGEQDEAFAASFQELAEQLEAAQAADFEMYLLDFAIDNQSSVYIYDSDNREVAAVKYSDTSDGNEENLSGTILFYNEGSAYSLIVSIPGGSGDQLADVFSTIFPYVLLGVLLLSLLAAFLLSSIIARPITRISDVSKKMTNLDMSWRCPVNRTDEIGILATNLNVMAEKLECTLEELNAANEQLMADIEREREQEKQRVDFFRTVSHELKTPLTILKGDIEGIIYGVGEYKNSKPHLRNCMRTIIEMEQMVKEILAVSQMSEQDFELSMSQINIGDMLNNIFQDVEGMAEDKEMDFSIQVTADQPLIYYGDQAMLYKALTNIFVNGIRHSPERERVIVTLTNKKLCVENTGVNISTEEMDKIYQPFYRVDQSHNSNTGGSGLGLYIVKTILDKHGLAYNLSNYDGGVRFTIYFA